jgi:hypothetical protein
VEPTYAQLIALFAAWLQDIDSEPFAYEGEWTSLDSPRYHGVTSWVNQQGGPGCSGGY